MKLNRTKSRYIRCMAVVLVLISLMAIPVNAQSAAYDTLTSDASGEDLVKTQTAYLPDYTIEKFGDMDLKAPEDMQILGDKIYVCDTGNARIVIGDMQGQCHSIVGEGILEKPTGISVAPDGVIFVADQGAQKVFSFGADGVQLAVYDRPTEPYYGKNTDYVPAKVAVGGGDNLFILSKGNTNGILQVSRKTGEFLGYFGANSVSVSLWEMISDAIFTEEQKSQMSSILPPSATNLTLDEKGMVYVLTDVSTNPATQLRKLNMAGVNVLENSFKLEKPAAIAVGDIGNIYVATKDGYLLEFDAEGNLLFLFGSPDDGSHRVGLLKSVSAIDVDEEGRLFVLDGGDNAIQVYEQTEFAKTVHMALGLYQEGKYLQCKEPWEQVLSLNSLFTQAQSGIGEAYYMEENYEAAMECFRLGSNQEGYSRSFAQVRNQWLRANMETLLIVGLAAVLLLFVLKKLDERWDYTAPVRRAWERVGNIRLVRQLKFLYAVPRNPADAAYGIKREKKTSNLSATVLFLVGLLWFLLDKYATGFIFSTTINSRYEILSDIAGFTGGVILVVLCHYLICAITDGEASLSNVYAGLAYACMPYLVLKPVGIVLSHVLCLQETVLLGFLDVIMYGGSIILIVVMIRELNDYTYRKTFKNIFLTLFAVVIAIATLFVLYILGKQFVDFIVSLGREVIYRVDI